METPMDPMRDKEDQNEIRGRYPDEGHEDRGQKRAAQNKKPGVIMVCNVAGRGLNHKGQEAADACKKTDLSQRESQFVHKKGKQGREESRIEVPGEVNQRQGENDF